MEDLGKYLKEYREEKGIEHITVYSDIRLREEQVKMMEENRFFELGPYGVVKATVFNYARYLGADLDAVMNELKILVPETTKNHHKPSPPAKQEDYALHQFPVVHRDHHLCADLGGHPPPCLQTGLAENSGNPQIFTSRYPESGTCHSPRTGESDAG